MFKSLPLIITLLISSSAAFGQMVNTFPFIVDFENQTQGPTGCGPTYVFSQTPQAWYNGGNVPIATGGSHSLDWTVNSGTTSSTNTGPSVDHTLGTALGKYIYIETSCSGTGYPSIPSELVSPWMDFTGMSLPIFNFWYHMYGTSMGTMAVDVQVGSLGTWTQELAPWTDNVDMWQEGNVYLSAYANMDSVRIRVRTSTGTSFGSDFGLDDLTVYEPQPYDLAGLMFDPMTCGLGQQPVTVYYQGVGSDTIPAGDTVYLNYDDGTNAFTDMVILGMDLNPGDTLIHTFNTLPDFSVAGPVTMQVWSDYSNDGSNGNDTIWMTFTVKPIIDTYPYLENFENGTGGFEAFNTTMGATNGTWQFGTPAKAVIMGAASGVNAWVAGGLTGIYNSNDNSYVEGPCFDFTTIDSGAYVSMKIWWEAEDSWDGANLQSTTDGGITWTNIGAFGDPNNWYNDNSISGAPGGSQEGWTGRNGNGSNGWVLAKHDIPASLYGQPSVGFRINFGSDGSVQDDGFAFDDFAIGYEDSIQVASLPDYNGCGPLTLDYGTTPGFYNWNVLDTATMAVNGWGAQYDGNITFGNPSNMDSTFYLVLDYADPSGSNQIFDTVLVTLSPSPYNVLNDTYICSGDSATFYVDTNSLYTYSWNNGSMVDSATYNTTGMVSVIVTQTVSGCADTASAMLTVGTPVDLPATAIYCAGDSVSLDAGAGYDTYAWSTAETTQAIMVGAAGQYMVTATDAYGCVTMDSMQVTQSTVTAAISASTDSLCLDDSVILDAGSGFSSYSWTSGGSSQTETLDGMTYGLGPVTVGLTVTDANGCADTDSVTVVVVDCVGLDELSNITLSVYPNPSKGVFNYELSSLNEDIELLVTDLSGKILVSEKVSSVNGTINLANNESGIYFLTFTMGDAATTVRLIKQ